MHRVLCVTAFRDIQRGAWDGCHKEWKRSNDEYIAWFANLMKCPIDLVCFCDEPIASQIKEKTGFSNILPYAEDDTFFKYVSLEKKVMESAYYRRVLAHRIAHPEHSIPEYNIVQHNKTSFIRRASQLFPEYTHYAWIDFGYVREQNAIPSSVNWEKVATNHIHYASFNLFANVNDISDPLSMCIHAPCTLQGSMFVLPKDLSYWYENAYMEVLMDYYTIGLTDDDQAIALQVLKKFPNKFVLHYIPEWFGIFKYLCA